MMDFISVLDQQAQTRGNKVALRAAGQQWTYAELAEQSRRAATVLRDQGVGPGDRVALLCYNTPGFIFALFGMWRLGAALVPVNHKLRAPEVEYILQHARVKVCIADGVLAPMAQEIKADARWMTTDSEHAGMPHFDALQAKARPYTDPSTAPHDDTLAEVLYTSGTTGRPKGCLHNHAGIYHTALCCVAAVSMTPSDRTLIAMPIWHASPLNNWLTCTLMTGATVVLLREYAPKAFLETMAAERITFTFGAPIAFLAPLSAVPDVSAYDLSAARLWTYGGGPLGEEMARKLAAAYKSDRFMQVYGMTETGPQGMVLYPDEALKKAGSLGRCGTLGVEMQLRREDGSACTAGDIGEIHLRSIGMMKGYLDDPKATAAAFDKDGWYRTGDMARIDEDGYLYMVDRLKDMIITGGENVYSKEVEDVLSVHPDVQDVAVIGRPHPEWGETVCAVLVLKSGRTLDEAAMKAYLEPKLARYKIPRSFEVRGELPRTASGKLMKHLLRT